MEEVSIFRKNGIKRLKYISRRHFRVEQSFNPANSIDWTLEKKIQQLRTEKRLKINRNRISNIISGRFIVFD